MQSIDLLPLPSFLALASSPYCVSVNQIYMVERGDELGRRQDVRDEITAKKKASTWPTNPL